MQQIYLGNHTAQLIGDHVGKTANEIQKELVLYIKKQKEYASQIGSVIWEHKKIDFDSYLDILSLDQTPFDEVASVLSARVQVPYLHSDAG